MSGLLDIHRRRAADLACALLMLRLNAGTRTAEPRQRALDYRATPSRIDGQRIVPGRVR